MENAIANQKPMIFSHLPNPLTESRKPSCYNIFRAYGSMKLLQYMPSLWLYEVIVMEQNKKGL